VPSHSAQNRGGQKKVRSPRILLVSKTDNPYVSTTNFLQHTPRVSLQKPISLAQPRDAYPYFVACRPDIETLLRAGHTMCRVWEAYRSPQRKPQPLERFGRGWRGSGGSSSLARRIRDEGVPLHPANQRRRHWEVLVASSNHTRKRCRELQLLQDTRMKITLQLGAT